MSLAEQVLEGNIRAAARLMRDIDDGRPEAIEELKRLYPHTGNAFIIGITGPPGAGKSTLVDQLIASFRTRGKKVGVVAIDPTSPFTGTLFSSLVSQISMSPVLLKIPSFCLT